VVSAIASAESAEASPGATASGDPLFAFIHGFTAVASREGG